MKKLCFLGVAMITWLISADGLTAPSDVTLKELYSSAKQEGKLIWQYPGPVSIGKPLADAFQAKYPEIKTSVFSYASTLVPTLIITESSARKLSMDLASAYPNYFIPLLERNLLAKYDWADMGVPQNHILLDGTNIAMEDSPWIWVYNTNSVSKANVPKTWEDILDPKWKGNKISIRAAPSAFASLFPEWKKDPKKVAGYLEKLRRQEVVAGKRAAEVLSRIATGECPIGMASLAVAHDLIKQKNSPVALCPIGPAASSPLVAAIPQNVAHPNAAKLFIAWLYSPDGREAYRKTGLGVATPCDASPVAQLLCDSRIPFIPITSTKDLKEFEGEFTKMVMDKMGFLPE